MPDYKYVTYGLNGEGTHGDYAYEWSVNGQGGYSVFVADCNNAYLAECHSYPPRSPGILWLPIVLPKDVVGDVFILLTDIAGEIERRIEGAQSVETAP